MILILQTQLLSDEIEKLRDQKGDLTKKITKVIENYYNLNLATESAQNIPKPR